MADLGAGSTGYPAALDTNPTPEVAGNATTHLPGEGSIAAAIAIETELGTDPAQGKSTVKAYLQTEHDSDGEHTFKVAHQFFQDDVAASQSAVAIGVVGSSTAIELEMPWTGSVVGISACVATAEARTAGSLTVDATVNGTVTGLQAVLDGTNTEHHSATQAKDTDAFSAGDRLGVKITTDAGWLPVSADVAVVVYVSYND